MLRDDETENKHTISISSSHQSRDLSFRNLLLRNFKKLTNTTVTMQLSWKNFLNNHPSTADLDTNAASIQTFFSSVTVADQKFTNLCENEALLLLTRSTVPKEVQATFHHSSRKDSFLQSDPFLLGLMGLGTKAYVVRTDPKLFFWYFTTYLLL